MFTPKKTAEVAQRLSSGVARISYNEDALVFVGTEDKLEDIKSFIENAADATYVFGEMNGRAISAYEGSLCELRVIKKMDKEIEGRELQWSFESALNLVKYLAKNAIVSQELVTKFEKEPKANVNETEARHAAPHRSVK